MSESELHNYRNVLLVRTLGTFRYLQKVVLELLRELILLSEHYAPIAEETDV